VKADELAERRDSEKVASLEVETVVELAVEMEVGLVEG